MSVYVVLTAVWGFVLYRHQKITHVIHYCVYAISSYCVIFTLINTIYYSLRNSYNYNSTTLLIMSWFVWVSCSISIRVITLAVALGYFINVNSISQHYLKILVLMFLTAISLLAELIVQYY